MTADQRYLVGQTLVALYGTLALALLGRYVNRGQS
jgi:hypothetical protein